MMDDWMLIFVFLLDKLILLQQFETGFKLASTTKLISEAINRVC